MEQDRLPYQGLSSSYIYEKMCRKLGTTESPQSDIPQPPPNMQRRSYTSQEAQAEIERAGFGWKVVAKLAYAGKGWIKKLPVIGPLAISIKESFLNRSGIEKDVSNLLALDTNEFIRESYRSLLGREADPEGFAVYQRLLCSGMPRECLFYLLASSEEFGQRFAVISLRHYKKAYRRYQIRHVLKRIPVFSHLIYLITLPKRIRNMSLEHRQCQADLRELTQSHQRRIDSIHHEIWAIQRRMEEEHARAVRLEEMLAQQQQGVDALTQSLDEFRSDLTKRQDQFDSMLARQSQRQDQVDSVLARQSQRQDRFDSMLARQSRRLDQAERVDMLQARRLDALELMPAQLKSVQEQLTTLNECAMKYQRDELPKIYVSRGILNQDSYLEYIGEVPPNKVSMDCFYEKLGKIFRANDETLEKHMEAYIPYIQRAFTDTREKYFLDLGCGKGAFVEQLLNHGVIAKGVDFNEASIEEGLTRGRNIQLSDGLEYLKSLDAETLSGVSMFQVAEHMSFDMLFEIAKEISRTVAANGVVLIETINSWCYRRLGNFHLDPSHCVFPSPDGIKLMLEMLGFSCVEVLYCEPITHHAVVGDPLESNYENYCVIGWKAGSPT